MDKNEYKEQILPFSQLYSYYFGIYLPVWVLNILVPALISGSAHRFSYFINTPQGIFISLLIIIILIILGLFITLGFYFIIHHWGQFNIKSKISLLIFGTYWYNIILIPISTLQVTAQGYTENGISMLILGPLTLLLPSLAFVLMCQRRVNACLKS